MSMEKRAGGPGSGVEHHNTAPILDYAQSDAVSIGNRRHVLETRAQLKRVRVTLSRIKFVGQKNYVIKKLARLMDDPKGDWLQVPVALYFDGTHFHVMDGHHRFLAAARLGKKSILATVWTKLPKELTKEAYRFEDDDEMPDPHAHLKALAVVGGGAAVGSVAGGLYGLAKGGPGKRGKTWKGRRGQAMRSAVTGMGVGAASVIGAAGGVLLAGHLRAKKNMTTFDQQMERDMMGAPEKIEGLGQYATGLGAGIVGMNLLRKGVDKGGLAMGRAIGKRLTKKKYKHVKVAHTSAQGMLRTESRTGHMKKIAYIPIYYNTYTSKGPVMRMDQQVRSAMQERQKKRGPVQLGVGALAGAGIGAALHKADNGNGVKGALIGGALGLGAGELVRRSENKKVNHAGGYAGESTSYLTMARAHKGTSEIYKKHLKSLDGKGPVHIKGMEPLYLVGDRERMKKQANYDDARATWSQMSPEDRKKAILRRSDSFESAGKKMRNYGYGGAALLAGASFIPAIHKRPALRNTLRGLAVPAAGMGMLGGQGKRSASGYRAAAQGKQLDPMTMSPTAYGEAQFALNYGLNKKAFTSPLEAAGLGGALLLGAQMGRNAAESTASNLAPHGQKTRAAKAGKMLGTIGAVAGGLTAMHYVHKHNPQIMGAIGKHIKSDPETMETIRSLVRPAGTLIGGVGAGYLAGATVGGYKRLRHGK
jgi:hypothetical protein